MIIVDTREKDLHILKELERRGIPYVRKKLDYGDYSLEGYEDKICIERKGSINEIIGNFTKGRERFKREFERSKGKVYLMIESNEESINKRQYRSKMTPAELKSFIKTWCYKFCLRLVYVDKKDAADFVINTLKEVKQ